VDLIPEPEQVPDFDTHGNQSKPNSSVIDSMAIAGEILLTVSQGRSNAIALLTTPDIPPNPSIDAMAYERCRKSEKYFVKTGF